MSIQYLAGFVDGEGCLHWCYGRLDNGSGAPRVEVSNTYVPILWQLRRRFGGAIYPYAKPSGPRTRQAYKWYVQGKRARVVVRALLPYLVEKQWQAQLLLAACSEIPANRREILNRLKALKRISYTGEEQ